MADFTHTFTLNILTDDGRTIQVSHTDTLEEVDQVVRGFNAPSMDQYLQGPTSATPPQLDTEPILMVFQAQGTGSQVDITNTNSDNAIFELAPKQVFVMHGTETFELTTNAADTGVVETLEQIDFGNSRPNAGIAYMMLLGPTS